ncbi:hypothetical protein DFH06DRAFT_1091358, partial [Mycena polygramma]
MTPTPPPVHDDTYYLESITFHVEDRLFKVPRLLFERNSEIFADALKLPRGTDDVEGTSDQNPFRLEGISIADLDDFSRSCTLSVCNANATLKMPKDHWISVLKLSTLWRFRDARALAIDNLTSSVAKTPVEAITLARQYQVASWLRTGYTALSQSRLTSYDIETIGDKTALKIYQVREECALNKLARAGQNQHGYNNQPDPAQYFAATAQEVEVAFADEFRRADADSAACSNSN